MIRNATMADFNAIWSVYLDGRQFMRETGNPTQWGDFYPTVPMLEKDIEMQRLYVVEREGEICGVFLFMFGPDPWYAILDDGDWLSDDRYGVIHRIAAKAGHKGIFKEALDFCLQRISHMRIDTHEDNKVMQHILEKNGFSKRGIVYVHDHSPRIAFERL